MPQRVSRFIDISTCLLLTALVAAQGGCVGTDLASWVRNGFKLGPNYCKPPAPVAADWIQADDPRVKDRHLQDWWQVFRDPTLDALLHEAHDQNLTLRVMCARLLEARAQGLIALGELFPQTQRLTGQFSQTGVSHNTYNSPAQFSKLSPLPAPPNVLFGSFYPNWRSAFEASWELDVWGRYRRSIESADAKLEASVDNYDDALVSLLADVATNYVQYRVAQQRIRIAHDNVRIQQGVVELAELRFRVGTTTELDVNQARTVLEATRATLPVLQITLGQANDQLCILLAIPPRDLEERLGPGPELGSNPIPNTPAWVAAGIPADLLCRRPDVRSAERAVAAQSAQIGVAEADLYPAISINGTLGYAAADISRLFDTHSFFGNVAPGYAWNVLNYGRLTNNVRLQQARADELIASYQNLVLTAAREAQTALRGFLRSQQQADDLARAVEAAVAATDLGLKQYKAGIVAFTTVFQLETAQVQQQDRLAVAQGNVALNLISVYRALGGGWEIRLEEETCGMPAPGPPADALGASP